MSLKNRVQKLLKAVNDCYLCLKIDDIREIVQNWKNHESDFTVNDYRFIHEDYLTEALTNDMKDDPEYAGLWTASFISDVTGWDLEAIEAIQKKGAFEGLGKMLIAEGYAAEMAEQGISTDGAGHFFNNHDGGEYELDDFLAFRQN